MTAAAWAPPPLWSVPRGTWLGARCLVICGGESVRAQRDLIPRWSGRVIAVKEGAYLYPEADALFFAGEHPEKIAPGCLAIFRGPLVIVRGRGHSVFPPSAKRIGRTATHERWSTDPAAVAGFDSGTSAINLAILFGAIEIVVVGYDMQGGRWFTGEIDHPNPRPAAADFDRHLGPLPALAKDAERLGVRIVNCSPTSRVTCFDREPFEACL